MGKKGADPHCPARHALPGLLSQRLCPQVFPIWAGRVVTFQVTMCPQQGPEKEGDNGGMLVAQGMGCGQPDVLAACGGEGDDALTLQAGPGPSPSRRPSRWLPRLPLQWALSFTPLGLAATETRGGARPSLSPLCPLSPQCSA